MIAYLQYCFVRGICVEEIRFFKRDPTESRVSRIGFAHNLKLSSILTPLKRKMKFINPALLTLASTPTLIDSWSVGPSYFPAADLLLANRWLQTNRAVARSVLRGEIYSPRYQLIDNDKELKISFDIPGVKADDLDVSVEDGYLSVRGQRVASDDTSRITSKFVQTFSLDAAIDAEKLSATLSDGVLVVSAPKDLKRIEENVRKIPIVQSQGETSMKLDEKPTEAQLDEDEIDLDKEEYDSQVEESSEEATS